MSEQPTVGKVESGPKLEPQGRTIIWRPEFDRACLAFFAKMSRDKVPQDRRDDMRFALQWVRERLFGG